MLDDVEHREIFRADEQLGSAQCGVARGDKVVHGSFEQAYADRALGANIVAESSRQEDGFDVVDAGTPAIEQDAHAGSDGALGQLQLANVGLPKLDGAADGKLLGAVGEPAAGPDDLAVESGGDGVNQSAAADATRLHVANHGAFHTLMVQENPGNGAGSGAHAHLDGSR